MKEVLLAKTLRLEYNTIDSGDIIFINIFFEKVFWDGGIFFFFFFS